MRLLIAEDDAVSRKLIGAALTKMGYDVVAVSDGRQAWETLEREDLRLVICDWMMPEMDGLQLIAKIRQRKGPYIYTILLTSRGGKDDVINGLATGADDYVTKPFHRDELLVRLRAGERVLRLEAALEEKNRFLERMALVDALTGVGNRRCFDDQVRRVAEQSRRFHHPFSVVMLDLDRFKDYNDTLGHEAGDKALRRVGEITQQSIRISDMAFRYGGEEFVCLLPETDCAGAIVVAERVRQAIQAVALAHPRNEPFGVVTASLGVASFTGEGTPDCDELVRHADRALYAAKDRGRNCTISPLLPEPV